MLYVPSKARPDMVRKNLSNWLLTGLPVVIAVEDSDADAYGAAITQSMGGAPWNSSVRLLTLERSNQGIPYSRQMMLEDALEHGLLSMIQCDDDHQVSPRVAGLLRLVNTRRQSAAASGYLSIYAHFLGLPAGTGPHEHRGGMGQQVVAYRTKTVEKVGGYDLALKVCQDVELHMRLVLNGYAPWWIHTDIPIKMIGKKYQDGGIAAFADRDKLTIAAYEHMVAKYGEHLVRLVSRKGRQFCSVRWRQVYEEAGVTTAPNRRR